MIGTPDGPLWHDGHTWRDKALCAASDLDWFDAQHEAQAVAICRECPVSSQCLEDALRYPKTSDRWGVFGGRTPTERDRIRRQRKKEAA